MNAGRSSLSIFKLGRHSLDDPVMVAWDTIQRGEPTAAADSADAMLIARFLASDTTTIPSWAFVDRLGQQLADIGAHERATTGNPTPTPHARNPPKSRRMQSNPDVSKRASRGAGRPSAWIAVAAVLAIALAGLLVVYSIAPGPSEPPAIPAAEIAPPTPEPLVRFDFDPPQWAMPPATTWTHMDFSIIALAPGKSFDTDQGWYTSTAGPLLLYILDGELTIKSSGASLLYRGEPSAPTPVAIDPWQSISLEPNDGIVYSIQDTATGSNPGTETMHALIGLTGSHDFTVPSASFTPDDVRSVDFSYVDGMSSLPTKGASVSLQRLELEPFDSFVFAPDANWKFLAVFDPLEVKDLRIAEGAVDGISLDVASQPVSSSGLFRFLVPGQYTIFNLGEETVDIYFMVVEPAPEAGTPAA